MKASTSASTRCVARKRSGLLEARLHGWLVPEELDCTRDVSERAVEALEQLGRAGRVHVEPYAPGSHHPAPEAAPADERGHVEEIAPQPAAVGGGREVANVARECAQVACVVRETLELERDAAQHLGPGRNACAGQSASGVNSASSRWGARAMMNCTDGTARAIAPAVRTRSGKIVRSSFLRLPGSIATTGRAGSSP